MTVVSVDIPEIIANKFSSQSIILWSILYEELDNYEWKSVKVWKKASVVLDYLKSIK